jgi:hypothetical protein
MQDTIKLLSISKVIDPKNISMFLCAGIALIFQKIRKICCALNGTD